MDWKLLAGTFAAIFLAELGDKTQIATFAAAAGAEKGRLAVFVGSAAALVASSALAVLAGSAVGRVVPVEWLQRLGGVVFVAYGGWMLWRSFGS